MGKEIVQLVKIKIKGWSEYYKNTQNKPPSPLLIKALNYVEKKNKALDIGGGVLNDSKYLLQQEFEVTVIDSSDLMAKEAEKINSNKLHCFVVSFAEFRFPENEFDIASAAWSLPFNPPDTFDRVFSDVKRSLVKGGIFCGQLFGIHDEWAAKRFTMTFHTKEQVMGLLSDMEIISLNEKEEDSTTANGTQKHWHVFNFIVKKK